MNIFIDLIIVAILVFSSALAAKKGLISTLFSLLSTIVAIVLSIALSSTVSTFIDNNFVNPSVKKYILTVVDSSTVGKSYDDALNSIDVAGQIREMPESLKKVLKIANIDTDEIIEYVDDVTENTMQAKDELINSIAKPISGTISRVIALVVLFLILSIALWVVSKLITAVFNALPLGKTLNKIGGLAFGVLRGLLIVFAIALVFGAFTKTVDPDSNNIFSEKTINSTVLLKTSIDLNPIGFIIK